jgi:agmatine deiminase
MQRVRLIDESTVLVNQYPKNKAYEDFNYTLNGCLSNAGLRYIDFPYYSWKNDDPYDANGCYINFLEIGNYIFLPQFSDPEDPVAFDRLRIVFKEREIIKIDCRELSKLGGILNCASWNILKH